MRDFMLPTFFVFAAHVAHVKPLQPLLAREHESQRLHPLACVAF
jgi:hypothetical protein